MKFLELFERQFLYALIKKTFIVLGLSYFSSALTTQTFTNPVPALIACGIYFFYELGRFYKVGNVNETLRIRKKRIKTFTFLI